MFCKLNCKRSICYAQIREKKPVYDKGFMNFDFINKTKKTNESNCIDNKRLPNRARLLFIFFLLQETHTESSWNCQYAHLHRNWFMASNNNRQWISYLKAAHPPSAQLKWPFDSIKYICLALIRWFIQFIHWLCVLDRQLVSVS